MPWFVRDYVAQPRRVESAHEYNYAEVEGNTTAGGRDGVARHLRFRLERDHLNLESRTCTCRRFLDPVRKSRFPPMAAPIRRGSEGVGSCTIGTATA